MIGSQAVGRFALLADKNSPGLLLGAGIVGMVGSTVLACRATLKVESVLDKAQEDLAKVKTAAEQHSEEYSEKDKQHDTVLVYIRTGARIIRLYAPAIFVGGVSIAALTQSHAILTRRNAAITAAYAALEKGFAEYRERVVERYGPDVDREMRYGSEKVQVKDAETGRTKTVVRVAPGDPSVYARFFDQLSPSWSKNPETNLIFLKAQQNYANDLLISRGYLFLNEVYGMLGIPHSKAGQVVGWLLKPDGSTDNFINFGLFDDSEKVIDFVNGREASVLLDFNVDGLIYDKIDSPDGGLSWQKSS